MNLQMAAYVLEQKKKGIPDKRIRDALASKYSQSDIDLAFVEAENQLELEASLRADRPAGGIKPLRDVKGPLPDPFPQKRRLPPAPKPSYSSKKHPAMKQQVKRRNPWLVILFGVITFSIYLIVWLFKVNNEARHLGAKTPSNRLLFFMSVPIVSLMLFIILFISAAASAALDPGSIVAGLGIMLLVLAILNVAAVVAFVVYLYGFSAAISEVGKGKPDRLLVFVLFIIFWPVAAYLTQTEMNRHAV